MSRTDDLRVADILEAADQLAGLVAELPSGFEESDWVRQRASERLLEIIGEAANALSDEFRSARPDIQWRHIINLRPSSRARSFRVSPAQRHGSFALDAFDVLMPAWPAKDDTEMAWLDEDQRPSGADRLPHHTRREADDRLRSGTLAPSIRQTTGAVRFSPDGSRIVTGPFDVTFTIWPTHEDRAGLPRTVGRSTACSPRAVTAVTAIDQRPATGEPWWTTSFQPCVVRA